MWRDTIVPGRRVRGGTMPTPSGVEAEHSRTERMRPKTARPPAASRSRDERVELQGQGQLGLAGEDGIHEAPRPLRRVGMTCAYVSHVMRGYVSHVMRGSRLCGP